MPNIPDQKLWNKVKADMIDRMSRDPKPAFTAPVYIPFFRLSFKQKLGWLCGRRYEELFNVTYLMKKFIRNNPQDDMSYIGNTMFGLMSCAPTDRPIKVYNDHTG